MAPVGSTAVREFIEEAQPLLGLHGHVHEGRGTAKIGERSVSIPAVTTQSGMLNAAIIEIADGRMCSPTSSSGVE